MVYIYTYGPVPIGDSDPGKIRKAHLQHEAERDERLSQSSGTQKSLSGWLTVRRQFIPLKSSTATFSTIPASDSSSAIIEADSDTDNVSTSKEDTESRPSSIVGTSESKSSTTNGAPTYTARIAQTYRQVMDARQARKEQPPKEYFYCVLKGSVLFLYEDEAQTNCIAAIGVDKYTVGIETPSGPFDGRDAEMFAKRNAICLRVVDGHRGINVLAKGMDGEGKEEEGMENAPWFLFNRSNIKMEDWYLALLSASALKPDTADIFSQEDMQSLVDSIDAEADPIPMRWLNAILGRLFFSAYRTEALERFIISRIMKKLSKVPRPSFLSPIVVREVNVGTSPPFFSKPMLKDLTADGSAAFEVHAVYKAKTDHPDSMIRITIATTATIPTGFKPYNVDLVLAVVLKSMEGNMVVQIKKPPSNRIWYGFTHMPKMEVEIRPVVSDRKIQIGMVLRAIEKQLKEVIAESIVIPNMDDIAFFNTSQLDIRGGIFSSARKASLVPRNETEEISDPIEISTSAEDPASATAETPALRKRRTAKSQTLSTTASLNDEGDEPLVKDSISRVETAPPTLVSGHPNRKATAIQATRKWFATTSHRPSSSLSHSPSSSNNPSQDNLLLSRSKSSEPTPTSAITPDPTGQTPRLSVTEPSTALPVSTGSSDSLDPPSSERQDLTRSSSPESNHTIGKPGVSSTATLISSLRARDKKALASQVNAARDTMKKWGVNFAAKRKAGLKPDVLDDRDPDKPAALYRPEEDEVDIPSSPQFKHSTESPGLSLQDRLNAVAHVTTSRPMRAGSTSSQQSLSGRPALASSPKFVTEKILGVSPPTGWTLGSGGPTTEVVKDAASGSTTTPATISSISKSPMTTNSKGTSNASSVSGPGIKRTQSTGPTVSMQPHAGRSMVVPRVPKRPGEVTGFGSSNSVLVQGDQEVEGQHKHETDNIAVRSNSKAMASSTSRNQDNDDDMKRSISEGEQVQVGGIEKLGPPPLPPRKESHDGTSSDLLLDHENDTNSENSTSLLSSTDARHDTKDSKTITPSHHAPPPLPARHSVPIHPANEQDQIPSVIPISPSQAPSSSFPATHSRSPQQDLPSAIEVDTTLPNPHDLLVEESNDNATVNENTTDAILPAIPAEHVIEDAPDKNIEEKVEQLPNADEDAEVDTPTTAAQEALRELVKRNEQALRAMDVAAVRENGE
ncbi:hypothetical protein M231_01108 [Tremella mesenterica]|uniref:SMP-LTD domain-containing protein n=1 Tax=Tremella mesenterica TaxID=5217 RepID=A0A4Q1BU38_TREME|nr:hypothetical protein M231_01108 [Tremella mesenterica]